MIRPEVTIYQGDIHGSFGTDIQGKTFFKFQGIPYAKPPLGELRFKAPQPPEKFVKFFDASREGDPCYQRDLLRQVVTGSENCLFLNVYTKQLFDSKTKPFPVMVWIHGGGFIFGSGSEDFYGPDYLMTENIVLVTFNYRVGILGFLSLHNRSLGIPGNAGFKDMVMALKWVQKNIYKFGGDPDNVTIFGECAGAASVHLLFLSPMGRGLFHKVAAQSGCALNPWSRGTKGVQKIAEVLKLEDVNERFILEFLNERSVEELFEIQEKIYDNVIASDVRPFGYVIESKNSNEPFLTQEPYQTLLEGNFPSLPFLTGFTTAEGMLVKFYRGFKIHPRHRKMPPLESYIPWSFGHRSNCPELKILGDKIKKCYFDDEEPSVDNIGKTYNLISDIMFIYGICETVLAQYHQSDAPTYVYKVSIESELNLFKKLMRTKEPGISHSDEVGYLFKHFLTPEIAPGSIEDVIRSKFVRLWTNFAKYGDPTPSDKHDKLIKVIWRPVTSSDIEFLEIGEELKLKSNPSTEKMEFWNNLFLESPAGKQIECQKCQNLSEMEPHEPELTIEQGILRGSIGKTIRDQEFYKFQGIPYAKPPLGDLRFKAPEPPDKWTGIFDASKEGDACYQRDLLRDNIVFGSEECLVLNVYTKELSEGQNQPVMFWIHGGGYIWGCASEELYGPDFLMTEDIVLVTINYRLGILGFLNLEDPALDIPGNAGLKDMVMALKWVQENISKFGGDPNNVTIFGESAGGASVHLLFLSPLGKGLFHKGIAQSGSALSPWVRGCKGGYRIAEVLGLEGADDKIILEHLMQKTVEELFEIQEKIVDKNVACEFKPFGLVVESTTSKMPFLTQEPYEMMLKGEFSHLPFMTGFTTAEGMVAQIFINPRQESLPSLETYIPWYFGFDHNEPEIKELGDKIRQFYFNNEEPSGKYIREIYDLVSDSMFIYGVYETVLTQYHLSQEPIYLYRMSIETELNFCKKLLHVTEPGVSHLDDVGYLFNHFLTPPITPGSIEDIALTQFVKLWTNFAKFGNPTPDKHDQLLRAVWKPVINSEIDFLDIGQQLTPMTNPLPERMAFWRNLFLDSPTGRKSLCFRMRCCN